MKKTELVQSLAKFSKMGVALFEKKGCAKEKKRRGKKEGGGNREA